MANERLHYGALMGACALLIAGLGFGLRKGNEIENEWRSAAFQESRGIDLNKSPDGKIYTIRFRTEEWPFGTTLAEVLEDAFSRIRRESGCDIPPMTTSVDTKVRLAVIPDCTPND